jgi:hypothetical protein
MVRRSSAQCHSPCAAEVSDLEKKKYHNLFAVNATGLVSRRYDGTRAFLVEVFEDEKTINAINAKLGKNDLGQDLKELDLLEKVVQTNFANAFDLHGSGIFDKV